VRRRSASRSVCSASCEHEARYGILANADPSRTNKQSSTNVFGAVVDIYDVHDSEKEIERGREGERERGRE
jgi:hypothetical protein